MVWFIRYHEEKVPSAVERYVKEVNRVTGVLDGWLKKQKESHGEPWLVGGKLSYVDLAFIPWQRIAGLVVGKELFDEDQYPFVKEWLGKIVSREGVKSAIEG
jgi:glutathione S-transferase